MLGENVQDNSLFEFHWPVDINIFFQKNLSPKNLNHYPDNFIKHKSHISKEWNVNNYIYIQSIQFGGDPILLKTWKSFGLGANCTVQRKFVSKWYQWIYPEKCFWNLLPKIIIYFNLNFHNTKWIFFSHLFLFQQKVWWLHVVLVHIWLGFRLSQIFYQIAKSRKT